MNPWDTLNKELNAWAEIGKIADLWWRDDDAIAPGPKLDQLISITKTTGLLLAVIPANMKAGLAVQVSAAPHVKVAQHGYAHINHAPRGQGLGAWELGLHRGELAVLEELDLGRQHLEAMFGSDFIPVIVPPWNHMEPALLEPLAARGFNGVSRFGPRDSSPRSDGLVIVNSHCDPIRWKTGAKFKGDTKTINQLVEHLSARRNGNIDAAEPTGYLTHHIDLDEAGWAFSHELVQQINNHPAACWCSDVAALFGEGS